MMFEIICHMKSGKTSYGFASLEDFGVISLNEVITMLTGNGCRRWLQLFKKEDGTGTVLIDTHEVETYYI